MSYTILLTFDVEDWFQVENFKQCISFSSWPNCELRVEKNVHCILDLLDSIKLNKSPCAMRYAPCEPLNSPSASHLTPYEKDTLCAMRPALCGPVKATFFILGWIAERLPHLVREIHTRGHEVVSHGYYHELCCRQSPEELKKDLTVSKKLLEDIIGAPVNGYRAPSFSINDDILKMIRDAGYLYDSSYNSSGINKRHGKLSVSGNGNGAIEYQPLDGFYELPISNLSVGNRIIPWGGGGYFRLIPFSLFKQGVHRILSEKNTYIFYMHPWEIDPEQPRVDGAPWTYRFRHYINLNQTQSKLSNLIEAFSHSKFLTCTQYLNLNGYHVLDHIDGLKAR